MKELIAYEIQRSIEVKQAVLNAPEIISKVEDIVNDCLHALRSGEFVSRLRFDRAPLA
jgi:hypothetical protein